MIGINRPISECYWIEQGRFLAGEFPGHSTTVELLRQRLDGFLDFGINTFIDLTNPNELVPYLTTLEDQAKYYDMEIQYKNFKITDHDIPEPDLMETILDEIDSSLAAGRKVYVHCWGGIGRTGTTVGCYLIRHGLTGQQALAQLAEWWKDVPKSRFWPHSPETDRQMDFVLNWREKQSSS